MSAQPSSHTSDLDLSNSSESALMVATGVAGFVNGEEVPAPVPAPLSTFVQDMSNALVPISGAIENRSLIVVTNPFPVPPGARIPWCRKALQNAGNLSDQWKLKQYFGDITNLHSGYWDHISKTVSVTTKYNGIIEVKYEDGKPNCLPEIQHLYRKLKLKLLDDWSAEIESVLLELANNIKFLELECQYPSTGQVPIIKQFINLQELKIKIMFESQLEELVDLLKNGKYKSVVVEIPGDDRFILQKIIDTNLNEVPNLQWIFTFRIRCSYFTSEIEYFIDTLNQTTLVITELGDKVKFEIEIEELHAMNLETDGLIVILSDYSEQIQKLSLEINLSELYFEGEEALKARLTKLSPYITHLSIRNRMDHTHWNIISAEAKWEKLIKLDISLYSDHFVSEFMIYHGPLTFLAQMSALKELKLMANFNMILGGSGSINSSKKLIKEYFIEKALPKLEKLTIEENHDIYMFVEGNELDLCLKSCLPFTQIEYVHVNDDDDEFSDSFPWNDEDDDDDDISESD